MIHNFTAELECQTEQVRSWGHAAAHQAQEEEEEKPSSNQQHPSGLSMALGAVPFQLLHYLATQG